MRANVNAATILDSRQLSSQLLDLYPVNLFTRIHEQLAQIIRKLIIKRSSMSAIILFVGWLFYNTAPMNWNELSHDINIPTLTRRRILLTRSSWRFQRPDPLSGAQCYCLRLHSTVDPKYFTYSLTYILILQELRLLKTPRCTSRY